jgi:hypothetical protein
MANEISISAVTGLTIEIQLYSGTTPTGVPFSATEIGALGSYVASMPSGVPYGKYVVVAMSGLDYLGCGGIYWDGQYELIQSTAMLRGLDPNNPATQTTTSLTSGDIDIAVTGDGENTTTFTRNA